MSAHPVRGTALLPFMFVVSLECSFSQQRTWTESFAEDSTSFATEGENPFFILKPGYQLELTGMEGAKSVYLLITVLDETQLVDGVVTRIVEERESANGEVVEVSRNFFAISTRTNCVYYFGEDVDIYKGGKVVRHEGAWRSGVDGARYGLMMPGVPLLGSRYYQEIAPGVAMDRAEVRSLAERVQTRAGAFEHCLMIDETTPLEPKAKERKYYAPGIGLIQDGKLTLARYGFVKK